MHPDRPTYAANEFSANASAMAGLDGAARHWQCHSSLRKNLCRISLFGPRISDFGFSIHGRPESAGERSGLGGSLAPPMRRLLRLAGNICPDGPLQARSSGFEIVQGLDLRGSGFRQRSLGTEDIQLGARAGVAAGPG